VKVETNSESGKKDSSRAKGSKVAQKRALVVEEEPVMCALIQDVLRSADMEAVIPAKNIETDHHFCEEKFDVIVIGLCTASGDGIELVRKMRKSGFNRTTLIILLSDDQRPGALSRAFEAGASFFVYKPIDKARLMSLICATQVAIESEKRRFRRIPLQVKVQLKSDKAEVVGETIDISLNGALIRVPHTLPLGSLVEITLYLLEGMEPIVGLGTIVRILSSTQMGILLDRFPVSEIRRLQEYLIPRIVV
jgi:DNA-binding response OmpR family regulator